MFKRRLGRKERTDSLELEAASIWRNMQRTYGLIDRPNCAGIGSDATHEQGNLNSVVDVFDSPFLWVQPRVKIEQSEIVHIPASTSSVIYRVEPSSSVCDNGGSNQYKS
jgi:hypothetical protein